MIARILAAYSIEFANAIRIRMTYAGPAAVFVTVLLVTFQFPISKDTASDFAFVAVAMPAALDLVGVFVLLWYGSTLISMDTASGIVRLVLVRPLRRWEYFIAKLLMAWTYALVLMAVAAVTSCTLAFAFGELSGIYYGDQVVYTGLEMRNAFLIALALNLPSLFATATFSLSISALTRNRGLALALTLVIWIALDLLKQPLQIQDYFFSTYLEHAWNVFSDRCNALPADWSPIAEKGLLVTGIWTLACCIIAVGSLTRQDFNR